MHRFYDRQPNRIREVEVSGPNQVWVGDITYLPVAGQWWYLAVVLDRYSRRVLAWSLTSRRDSRVTCAVLKAAARQRGARGVGFHSDRGSEYKREYMAAPFHACVLALSDYSRVPALARRRTMLTWGFSSTR